MNCELPESESDSMEPAKGDARAMARERFLKDFADGLHAMAQPLTILHGALSGVTLRGPLTADQQRYLEMSSKQLARLSEMLRALQDQVDAVEAEPEIDTSVVSELVESAVEGLEQSLLRPESRVDYHADMSEVS